MEHERIALVTGANSGIGKITAKELAKKGMRVLMVCRDARKGEVARNEIITESGNHRVDLLLCDLSDQESIVQLAGAIRSKYQHLDVLINNAGLIMEKRLTTPQGLEYTFALNHLAPFLLTHLLLNQLRKGDDARVITVSSEAHRFARLDFSDLQSEKKYSSMRAYANSKLANILFTRQLSSILKADGISANCLHPGVVSTNFGGSFQSGFAQMLLWLGRPFFISPEKGAETSVFLASSPEVKGMTGLYFDKKKTKKPSESALSQFNSQRLWDLSLELTKLEQRLNTMKEV
jgi:NAD(P)-dependent dehydrogenase (short-subunit alcohol dehydrogenase family)